MGDELVVREGERIPRRPLPEFEEATSFGHAISRDGFFGTAVADKNQYGPAGHDDSSSHRRRRNRPHHQAHRLCVNGEEKAVNKPVFIHAFAR